MMNTKGLFAVSLIAMLAMGTANADIASKNYVDVQVGGRLSSISGSTSGTGNVVTSVSASGSTVSATKGITAEETKNKVTTVRATASATDTAYPSEKAVATALAGKADSADIPTVNNATLTIQKNGSNVGTFTANAASPATINITVPTTTSQLTNNSGFITADDLPEDYVLTAATSDKLGGVKSGGDITVGTDGTVTVNSATSADTATTATSATNATNATNATKATQDALGNVITTTYATKTELSTGLADKANTDDLATVATSGSYNDLTNKPTIPSAYTLPAATSSALGGVKSGGDITVGTDGTVTVNSATSADTATTATSATNATNATNATKATQDASGNVITTTYATKTELSTGLADKANTDDLATVATSGSYNDLTNKPTIPTVDSALSSSSTNPVQNKVINSALAGKLSTTGTAAKATADANGNNIVNTYATKTALASVEADVATAQSTADDAADAAASAQSAANTKVAKAQGSTNANKVLITDGSGNVTTGTVSSAMITDGTITNADISSSAAIAQSKISGLTNSLNAKANTADLAAVATSGSYNDLTNKPSIPAAITVDSSLSSTSTNPVQNKVINSALAGKLSTSGTAAKATADANGNNIASTYATKSQITALDSTSSGTGAVVTAVSQTDGKVSVTKGNVKIPVGSESATTYATIWVE